MEARFSTQDRLEVSLVPRLKLADTNAIFFAVVLGAGTTKVGRRWLKLRHEDNSYTDVGTQETLFLDDYFLLGITWTPERMGPEEPTEIETPQEQQNDGFEVICHILEQAGIQEIDEEEEPETIHEGPKRVEVVLNSTRCAERVTLAVIEYMPPSKPFNYHTIKGRQWVAATGKLSRTVRTFNSDQWWVYNIIKYPSPQKMMSSFHGRGDPKAWGQVEKFMSELRLAEIEVVRNFGQTFNRGCGGRSNYRDWSVGQQSQVPSHYRNPYQTPTVFFRVAGDEVGRKAYLVQAERQVKNPKLGPPTLEEFLDHVEKKDVAGDASASPETSSALPESNEGAAEGSGSNPKGSGTDSGADVLPDYDPTLDPMGCTFSCPPYIPGACHPEASAIERVLRRFPGAVGLGFPTGTPATPRNKKKETLH